MLPNGMEWLVIFGVALLIFGPKNLPKLGGAVGRSIREFKDGLKGLEGEGTGEASEKEKSDDEQEKSDAKRTLKQI